MPSLAATQGIAFSADEIRSVLEAAALTRFTGTVQISIGVNPDAAKCVGITVLYRHSHVEQKPGVTRQELPDPTLRKPVAKVIEDISSKLFIRTALTAMEIRFLNGVVQPHWTHDE